MATGHSGEASRSPRTATSPRSRRCAADRGPSINDVNARVGSVKQVKSFRLIPKELDHEEGELTATQKVKRAAISKMFGDLVEEMYR